MLTGERLIIPSSTKVSIEFQPLDITALAVDVVVNAAGSALRGGGGVDGAIHKAAGPRLKKASMALGPCPPGEVRVTEGFNLPARYIIHAVGPRWRGGIHNEPHLLSSSYRSALEQADWLEARSIAFPALSCGVFGYPIKQAAEIAMEAVFTAMPDLQSVRKIIFACLSPATLAAFRDAWQLKQL